VTSQAERSGTTWVVTMPLRAYAYHGLHDHDRAIGAWRVALARVHENRWAVRAFLARSLALAGYPADARAAADTARAEMLAEMQARRAAADSASRANASDLTTVAPHEAARTKAAAGDSVVLSLMARFDVALRNGCYASARGTAPGDASDHRARPAEDDGSRAHSASGARAAFLVPSCDPLGDWFIFTGNAQTATQLHNATRSAGQASKAPVATRE
jgi:hypothetical protein